MAFITIRVPESLKRKMRRVKGVNWSALVRGAIEERVRRETVRRRERDRSAIIEAVRDQDRIAVVLAQKPAPSWSGVEVIRYWREHRYSSSTRR